MRKNEIGDAGKLAIGKALLASESSKLHTMHCDEWSIDPSITELDLSGKKLKAADATFLAGIIKFSSPLTSLNVAGNNIGGQYVKQNEARGDSFKVGDIVEWKGVQGTITKEKDSDGEIFVQFMIPRTK